MKHLGTHWNILRTISNITFECHGTHRLTRNTCETLQIFGSSKECMEYLRNRTWNTWKLYAEYMGSVRGIHGALTLLKQASSHNSYLTISPAGWREGGDYKHMV